MATSTTKKQGKDEKRSSLNKKGKADSNDTFVAKKIKAAKQLISKYGLPKDLR